MNPRVPHLRIVVAVCVAAILGYLGFSVWVVIWSNDVALKGDVIGTWKSFAVLAFGFWLGSSSGGKATTDAPQPVTIDQPPEQPVPVEAR
ncbi:hypothetical protein [Sphingobium yanoikuyae]|jgi:hypothetical protein|uniref:hypothetical protein n=1 Tax=Sphingobium yanoikuyae TaxID=13690 RepID=UPI0028DC096E|nr:hypothetical protein [Sphingobium yanoikuyae]